jgi:hypothetical protein
VLFSFFLVFLFLLSRGVASHVLEFGRSRSLSCEELITGSATACGCAIDVSSRGYSSRLGSYPPHLTDDRGSIKRTDSPRRQL